MQLLQLLKQHVRIGAPLPWGIRDVQGKLLLARGQIVASEEQLEALLERGAYVDGDELRHARRQDETSRREPTLFERWEHCVSRLDNLLREPPRDGSMPARVEEMAAQVAQLLQRDPDVALFLITRQDGHRYMLYGATHSVHVGVLGYLATRRLGWDEAAAMRLLKAALTMNIAMIDLQGRLAMQAEPLTQAQQAVVRAHPAAGAQWLAELGVTDAQWLAAVADHHERPDGSGYPRGCTAIGELARILRKVDEFTARISVRAWRAALLPHHAARELFVEGVAGRWKPL